MKRALRLLPGAKHDRVSCDDLTSAGDLSRQWDADRLAQVASNLIRNALLHGMPDAPVHVCLSGAAPNEVTLVVANKGAIDPEALPHLFAPFRSGERKDGLGLGLYIAQQIVRAHDGAIDVVQQPGDETAFRVSLRRAPDARS